MAKCKHRGDRVTKYLDMRRQPSVIVECNVCKDCGCWIGLGKAKDTPVVMIEIRAAEFSNLADSHATPTESFGWRLWDWRIEYVVPDVCLAGWLAREIAMHDVTQGDGP